MNKGLAENQIHMINYHDDSITLKIDGVKSTEYTKLKQQILNNQAIVEAIKEFRDEVHDSWTWVDIQLKLDRILNSTLHSEGLRGNQS